MSCAVALFVGVTVTPGYGAYFSKSVTCGSDLKDDDCVVPVTIWCPNGADIKASSNIDSHEASCYPDDAVEVRVNMRTDGSGNGLIDGYTSTNCLVFTGSCQLSNSPSNILLYIVGGGMGLVLILFVKGLLS